MPAGRCRTASARSGARARPRRSRSGGTRPPTGRGCRRRPLRPGSGAPWPEHGHRHPAGRRSRPSGAAGTRSSSTAGTSARGPTLPARRRRSSRVQRPPHRAEDGPATELSRRSYPAGRDGPALRPDGRRMTRPRPDRPAMPSERRPAHPGKTATRAERRWGSRFHRRKACPRVSGRRSSASRPSRSSPARQSCRPGRGPAAPRGRP